MKRLIVLTLFFAFKICFAQNLSAIHENNVGVSQLEKEKAREAETHFLTALSADPFNLEIRYNLGTAYLAQKKFDRALKEYQTILRTPNLNPDIAFYTSFNAAIAAQELKNYDAAFDFYQTALNARPDSRETKVNIELLSQAAGQNKKGDGNGQGNEPNEKDDKGQGNNPNQDPNQSDNQQKDKPQSGKNFSKDELKKVFEELERQEQKVRALEYGTKSGREKGPDKDW
jgi:Ca-activated chloride channel homolog